MGILRWNTVINIKLCFIFAVIKQFLSSWRKTRWEQGAFVSHGGKTTHVKMAWSYLSVSTLPQNPQQLEALRSDALRSLVDIVLGDFDLLTVVHVTAVTQASNVAGLWWIDLVYEMIETLHANTYKSNPLHCSIKSWCWPWRK